MSKTDTPLVSVIVTTYNNQQTLAACLDSIQKQSYPSTELIVVDNHSTDNTLQIAREYTTKVWSKGPERSEQRNFAVQQANGEYVLIIDSDMELSHDVVAACIDAVNEDSATKAVIIPEESFGEGFWAQCKRLERSFYVGQDSIEAARFYQRSLFSRLGGYDLAMVSGEDWDLCNRARVLTTIARVQPFILHNEGHLRLWQTLKKKRYYASLARGYLTKNLANNSKLTAQQGPLQRYKLFLSQPGKLFRNPLIGAGVLFMKTSEFAAGAIGYYGRK